jgi:hypothetical protein
VKAKREAKRRGAPEGACHIDRRTTCELGCRPEFERLLRRQGVCLQQLPVVLTTNLARATGERDGFRREKTQRHFAVDTPAAIRI